MSQGSPASVRKDLLNPGSTSVILFVTISQLPEDLVQVFRNLKIGVVGVSIELVRVAHGELSSFDT